MLDETSRGCSTVTDQSFVNCEENKEEKPWANDKSTDSSGSHKKDTNRNTDCFEENKEDNPAYDDVEQPRDESPSLNLRQVAETFKEKGNRQFAKECYEEAKKLYTGALSFLSVRSAADGHDENLNLLEATLLANRAACHYSGRDYMAVVADAKAALIKDPVYDKASLRLARSWLQLGKFQEAVSSLEEATARSPKSTALVQLLTKSKDMQQTHLDALTLLEEGQFALAQVEIGSLLSETSAPSICLAAAEAELGLGFTATAIRFSHQVLQENLQLVKGYLIGGKAAILADDTEVGVKLLKQALRLDPDAPALQRVVKLWIQVTNSLKQARDDFLHGRFGPCIDTLTDTMRNCPLLPPKAPLYATLYTYRARAWVRIKDYEAALKDCAAVLSRQELHEDAWMARFAALHGLERYNEILNEISDREQKGEHENERFGLAWRKADFQLRKQERPDLYVLLEVAKDASEREIRDACHRKSPKYHPDLFIGSLFTDKQCEDAANTLNLMFEAVDILTNVYKKQLYDEGYGLEAIQKNFEDVEKATRHYDRHGQ